VRFRSLALLPVLAAAFLTPAARTVSASVPPHDHIIVVVMENKSYASASAQPYTAGFIAAGASFQFFFAYTHPSQPNYLMLWSGNTQGVTNDVCPPVGAPFTVENLGHACEVAGKTWRAYSEGLPAVGSDVCTNSATYYLRRHCPWSYFSNLDHNNERELADLATDIANNTLPNLAFVIPNTHDDTHDTGYDVTWGDNWLAANMPAMLTAVGPRGLVILTWDEDDKTAGNRILTVFNGPLVVAGTLVTGFTYHWNVVRTIADALGIERPGRATSAAPIDGIWFDPLGVAPGARGRHVLAAPVPNPSAGSVSARLMLAGPAEVVAGVYDLAGRRVRLLESGLRSGTVELRWDGRDETGAPAGAGVYMLRVHAGAQTLERKAVVLR
jgi:hypothetical protein